MQLLDVHTTTLHLGNAAFHIFALPWWCLDVLRVMQLDETQKNRIPSYRNLLIYLHASHRSYHHTLHHSAWMCLNPPAPWGSSQHRKKLKRPQCNVPLIALHDRKPLLALLPLVNLDSLMSDSWLLADAESQKGPLSKKTESLDVARVHSSTGNPFTHMWHVYTCVTYLHFTLLGPLQSTLVQCFEGSFS